MLVVFLRLLILLRLVGQISCYDGKIVVGGVFIC
jgi:hypothetical protein